MTPKKKPVEVTRPLEAINKASAREKSIRHGHPSTLHLWWARWSAPELAQAGQGAESYACEVDAVRADDGTPAWQALTAFRQLPKGRRRPGGERATRADDVAPVESRGEPRSACAR